MNLQEIQSIVRKSGSIYRKLSQEFIHTWGTAYSKTQYRKRDVGVNPPAHPTELWTKANYMPHDTNGTKLRKSVSSETLLNPDFSQKQEKGGQ